MSNTKEQTLTSNSDHIPKKQQKIYVLDTNVILEDIDNIKKLSNNGENIIAIPDTVLLELEEKKKSSHEIGYQARAFARLISKMKVTSKVSKDEFRIVKMSEQIYKEEAIEIHLISKNKYKADLEHKYIAEANDKRIVEACEIAQQYYRGAKVVFVSLDTYARMSALFVNIATETLDTSKSDRPFFQFHRKVTVSSVELNQLHGASIYDYEESHTPSNSCYEFNAEDGNKSYGIVRNNMINIMEDSDFNKLSVKPVNLRQKFLCKGITADDYDLIVVDAKAGSGKTLMAVSCAMRLIDQGKYDKIIYVRNSIESVDKGAEIGFLSGNEEKMRIYNMALYDTLEFIAKKGLGKKPSNEAIQEAVEKIENKYRIETLWPGEARGRTLSGSIVIMDEWQNSSVATSKLILSRLDNQCMGIMIGSNNQIDNTYLSAYSNGLTQTMLTTRFSGKYIDMFGCELKKAVRGRFAEYADEVF